MMTSLSFYSSIVVLLFVSVTFGQEEELQDIHCKKAVDIVFIFDSSQSVSDVFEKQKSLVERLISHLDINPFGALVGLIEYSRYARLVLPLSTGQTKAQVEESFAKLRHIGGYTLTADGVQKGVEEMEQGGRPDAEKLYVLVSDGHSFNKWSDVVKESNRLHQGGAKVMVIAIAEDYYMPELIEYAGGDGLIFTRDNVTEADQHFVSLTSGSCSTPPTATDEDCATDILFILDASGSVRDDIDVEKQFIKEAVKAFTIRSGAHRVALIEFSGPNTQIEKWDFERYHDKASLLQAVEDLPFFGGTTYLGEALKFAQKTVKKRRGDHVRLVIFVLSDGITYDKVEEPARQLRELPNAHVVSIGFARPLQKEKLVKIAGSESMTFTDKQLDHVKGRILKSKLNCARGHAEPTVYSSSEKPEEFAPVEEQGREVQSLAVHQVAEKATADQLNKYYKEATEKEKEEEDCEQKNIPNLLVLLDSAALPGSLSGEREAAIDLVFKLLNGHQKLQTTIVQYPNIDFIDDIEKKLQVQADHCHIIQPAYKVANVRSPIVVYITAEGDEITLINKRRLFEKNGRTVFVLTMELAKETTRPIGKEGIFYLSNVNGLYEKILTYATCDLFN